MAPMNKKEPHRVDVPLEDIWPPTIQDGFEATVSQLRSGDFGTWAKVAGFGGVGTEASREKSVYESASCTSVVTFYFDPDSDYVSKCLLADPISQYMTGGGRNPPPVYLLTGLKVAKKLKFHTEESRKAHASAKADASVAQTPVKLEAHAEATSDKKKTLTFETDDIVVGFRVFQYQIPKPKLFGKKKADGQKPVGKLYLQNAEMLGDQDDQCPKPLQQFEEVPIAEEVEAQEALAVEQRKEADGQEAQLSRDRRAAVTECWVDPTMKSG